MAKYTSISGNVTNQVLVAKANKKNSVGRTAGTILSLTITNTHDSATQTTSLNLFDGGSTTYILYNKIDIPPKTSLVLTDNLTFDIGAYSLRITTTGSSSCTVIIK
tara:strand:+ start:626 stop:943 length:318 start_codon:yes stop_codon:yes gene_type:complete